MLRIVLGFLAGLLMVPLIAFCWLSFGTLPVAVADKPLPMEQMITARPLASRIKKEMPATAPFEPYVESLTNGAQVYRDQCAVCHGFHGKPARIGNRLFPAAPPLWEKHPSSAVIGVSDDPIGATYWKVAHGIRLTAMPSFKGLLTDSQLWEVSQLLAGADKPLPPQVIEILDGKSPATSSAAATDPLAALAEKYPDKKR
jgi:mono/diheme cytochrome c family protein